MDKRFTCTDKQYIAVAFALLISLIIRIYISQFDGFGVDLMYFKEWSRAVNDNGILNFYSSTWSDYPPFYIYILWLVGSIYKLFFSLSFNTDTTIFTILLKSPANIIDIITSFLIFSVAGKYTGFKTAFFTMLFYAFNPAIVYNSAIWGQVDSVNTLFILLALIFLSSDKLELAGVSMAVAVLTKPQSLVLLPYIAILMIKDQKDQRLLKLTKVAIISVVVFIALALPFYWKTSLYQLIETYTTAYKEYSYTSLNAFNLWAFSGFWKPDDTTYLFLSYKMWAYILFGLLFIYVVYFTIKNGDNRSLYFASAIIYFGFFMLFTRIHERYLFPMFAPLVIAMSLDKRLIFVYWIMTSTFLFNLEFVLQSSNRGLSIPDGDPYVMFISGINLVVLIYTMYCFSTFRQESHGTEI